MLNDRLDAASAAFPVGYESPTQFNREYSRLFGTPPLRDVTSLHQLAAVGERGNSVEVNARGWARHTAPTPWRFATPSRTPLRRHAPWLCPAWPCLSGRTKQDLRPRSAAT